MTKDHGNSGGLVPHLNMAEYTVDVHVILIRY